MKKYLIASVIALAALVAVSQANAAFSTYLSVGSTGQAVSDLQTWLIANNYDIPAITSGAAQKGYFGQQTKAAVIKYQTAVGLPAFGYVGPLTIAKLNGTAGVATTASCPAGYTCTAKAPVAAPVCPLGYTCTANPGTVVTVVPGAITTLGAEGTVSATANSADLVSTAYVGDTMDGILGFDVEAKASDMDVQRIKLRMDETAGNSDTKFYNKIYKTLYVTVDGSVIGSIDLNTANIVKDSSNYYVTIAGFHYVIPKNTKKTFVIKADLKGAIDSTDYDAETYQLGLAANGVRAVDGAGIDQFAGGSSDNGIARTTTIAAILTESATLSQSLNASSPKKQDVIATAGSNKNEIDRLHLATFDVRAEKDDVKITDVYVGVLKTGSGAATANTAYLADAATGNILGSATVSSSVGLVSNFNQIVPKGTTKTYKILVDIRSANGVLTNFQASTTATALVAENMNGTAITPTGTVLGYVTGVLNRGPVITIISKSITTGGAPQNSGSNNIGTSTLTANFVFKIKAVGGSVQFGLTQSTTSPFFASSTPATGVRSVEIYRNGIVSGVTSFATSTSFTFDSICSTSGLTNSCTLSEGSEVIVPATFSIQGRSATGPVTSGLYSVGINGLNWGGTSTVFMNGELDWITSEVSFP